MTNDSANVNEPALDPVNEPALDPVNEPALDPVNEPALDSVNEPVLPLVGEWELTTWAGQDLSAAAQLGFSAEGRITGTAGVNRVMGDYTATDQAITFGMLATTMMMGPEEAMVQERTILAFLQGDLAYEIVDAELRIGDPDGEILAGRLRTESAG